MSRRTVRARVQDQRLELLEDLRLPEGTEVDVTLDVPEAPAASVSPDLPARKLGIKEPITRSDIYDDVA